MDTLKYPNDNVNNKSITECIEQLEKAQKTGNQATLGAAYLHLATVYEGLDYIDQAIETYKFYCELCSKYRDLSGQGAAFNCIGALYYHKRNFISALEYFSKRLYIARFVGDKAAEEATKQNILNTEHAMQLLIKKKEEEKKKKETLVQSKAEEEPNNTSLNYTLFRKANIPEQNDDESMLNVNEMDDNDLNVDDLRSQMQAYTDLGILQQRRKDYKLALKSHQRRLEIAQLLQDSHAEAMAYVSIAHCYYRLLDYNTAFENYQKVYDIAITLKDDTLEGYACCGLGCSSHGLGNLEAALEYHQRHLSISQQQHNIKHQSRAEGNIATIQFLLGDMSSALKGAMKQLELAENTEDHIGLSRAYAILGSIERHNNNMETAQQWFSKLFLNSQEIGDQDGEKEAMTVLKDSPLSPEITPISSPNHRYNNQRYLEHQMHVVDEIMFPEPDSDLLISPDLLVASATSPQYFHEKHKN